MEYGIYRKTEEEVDRYIDSALDYHSHDSRLGLSDKQFMEKLFHKKRHSEYKKFRYWNKDGRKISDLMSSNTYHAIKGNKGGRHWEDIVGYTLSDLKEHLESLFTDGMTWENQGAWHIDHLKPVSSFTFTNPKDEDFKLCFALSNLQPLWAKDNLEKSNKIDIKYNNL